MNILLDINNIPIKPEFITLLVKANKIMCKLQLRERMKSYIVGVQYEWVLEWYN